jgi:hypothetical protein
LTAKGAPPTGNYKFKTLCDKSANAFRGEQHGVKTKVKIKTPTLPKTGEEWGTQNAWKRGSK